MHLTEDGFIELISGRTPQLRLLEDDRPWPEIWDEFLSEARRWDGRKISSIFGDAAPIQPPPMERGKMTERDRFLIGEFLRRHHARLAQEIADLGVPGPAREKTKLGIVGDNLEQLAGLVARSHNFAIRRIVDLLPRETLREKRRAHLPFAAVVLRIADYLQIQTERAPPALLQVRSLKSPVSQREWNTHGVTEEPESKQDDPEAFFIPARREKLNIHVYLKLKELIGSIQRELDESWAVLGEVYGRTAELRALGIAIRRLHTNLEQRHFVESLPFVAARAHFDTAGADLLKTLIKPLYGDKPEIGVRELVQNAVDACLEFEGWRTNRGLSPQSNRGVTVSLSLTEESSQGMFEIRDDGIGMTVDTVLKYFLCAGASFRTSDSWKGEFSSVNGKSLVGRSGRFGVGVLAAFLIGNRLEVTTRHVSDKYGLTFSCGINDDELEIYKCEAPQGTTIKIYALNEGIGNLKDQIRSWDWYRLPYPSVSRFLNGTRLEDAAQVPACGSALPDRWHRLEVPGYQDVQWSWLGREKHRRHSPLLMCNGIEIRNEGLGNLAEGKGSVTIHGPTLSVFDSDGLFPLNLQRNSLTSSLGRLGQALTESVMLDFIAYCFAKIPENPLGPWSIDPTALDFTGSTAKDSLWGKYSPEVILTPVGVIPSDRHLFHDLRPRSVLLTSRDPPFELLSDASVVFAGSRARRGAIFPRGLD